MTRNTGLKRISLICTVFVIISKVDSQTTSGDSQCSFATGDHVFNIQLSRGISAESCSGADSLTERQQKSDDRINELISDMARLQSSFIHVIELNNNLTQRVNEMDRELTILREALRKQDDVDCPPSYEMKKTEFNSCYLYVDWHLTWYNAETYCMSTGGNLIAIETDAEQQFISEQIRTILPNNHIWTGASDIAGENEWVWAGSNMALNFTRWLAYNHTENGQIQNPDNDGGNENCMHLFFNEDFFWNDAYCGQRYYFICEFKLR